MTNILLGKITKVFGIKGLVQVDSYCQDPQDILNYQIIDDQNNKISLKLSNIKKKAGNKTILIVQINDITCRNEVQNYVGMNLYTNRDNFENLADNEYYYVDLINLKVIDKNNNHLGFVKNVYDYNAGGIIEIEFLAEIAKQNKISKIENFSFKDEFFPIIDVAKGYVVLQLPAMIS